MRSVFGFVLLAVSACSLKPGVPPAPATVNDEAEPRTPDPSGAERETVPLDSSDSSAVAEPAPSQPEGAIASPSESAPPPSPAEPSLAAGPCDPARDCCTSASDCVPLDAPHPCACAPCGKVLRWTLNQRGYADHEERWSRRRCGPRACTACYGEYVGQSACVEGRCVVR